MKANHNTELDLLKRWSVVVNISSSKNESKSQRGAGDNPCDMVVVNISSSKNESKSQPILHG